VSELARPAEHAQANTVIVVDGRRPSFVLRVVWYLLVGWWLTGLSLVVGYVAGLTIVGLPIAFWIFNRTGTLLTLRPRTQSHVVETRDGLTVVRMKHADQRPILLRAVYFVLVGWWAALIWMSLSYLISLTIIGIPIGLMMLNRLPEVFTLHRN
jgi:uncharacterized membrane protein YccF (DUF307 family)